MLCFTSAVEILPPSRFIGWVCPSRDSNTLLPMLAVVEPLSTFSTRGSIIKRNTNTVEYSIRKDQMPHGWGQSYPANSRPYPHLALVGGGGA